MSHDRPLYVGFDATSNRRTLRDNGGVAVEVHTSGTEGPFAGIGFRRQSWSAARLDSCLILISPGEIPTPSPRQRSGRPIWDWNGRELGESSFESLLAHEAFHCLHMEVVGPRRSYAAASWLTEGAAMWAGEAWAGGSERSAPSWREYLADPRDLLTRNYDAIGFWAQVDAAASDPLWAELPDILAQGARANLRGFRRAISVRFLNRWAPPLGRLSRLGERWDLDLPGMQLPDARLEPQEVSLAPLAGGRSVPKRLNPRTPTVYRVELPDPEAVRELRIEAHGHGLGAWGERGRSEFTIDGTFERTFCLAEDGEGCTCVQPDPETGELERQVDDVLWVGLAGTLPLIDAPSRASITFSGPKGYETPEEAIRACLVARNDGEAYLDVTPIAADFPVPVYVGDCGNPRERSGPGSSCSEPVAETEGQATYELRGWEGFSWVLLERREDGWAMIDIVLAGTEAGTSLPQPPPEWPQP